MKTSSLHPNFDAIFFQSSLQFRCIWPYFAHEYMKEIVFTVGFKVELNKEKLPKIEKLTEKLENKINVAMSRLFAIAEPLNTTNLYLAAKLKSLKVCKHFLCF